MIRFVIAKFVKHGEPEIDEDERRGAVFGLMAKMVGFDIAMNDAVQMQGFETFDHRFGDGRKSCRRKGGQTQRVIGHDESGQSKGIDSEMVQQRNNGTMFAKKEIEDGGFVSQGGQGLFFRCFDDAWSAVGVTMGKDDFTETTFAQERVFDVHFFRSFDLCCCFCVSCCLVLFFDRCLVLFFDRCLVLSFDRCCFYLSIVVVDSVWFRFFALSFFCNGFWKEKKECFSSCYKA
jgi:hypothetical protein